MTHGKFKVGDVVLIEKWYKTITVFTNRTFVLHEEVTVIRESQEEPYGVFGFGFEAINDNGKICVVHDDDAKLKGGVSK